MMTAISSPMVGDMLQERLGVAVALLDNALRLVVGTRGAPHAAGLPPPMTGFGSRRSLLRAAKRSTAFWAFSHNSGVVLKVAASFSATSAVTADRPFTMRLITFTSWPI